jgi:hypothetical protein
MLHYLTNNFILSAILSVLVTIFVYLQKRLEDDKDNKNNPKNMKSNVLFYAKLFIVVYGLALVVLLFKTKDYSLPFKLKGKMSGGALPSVAKTQAPWKEFAPEALPKVSTNNPSSSLVDDLSLNEVDIGEPKF